MSRKHHRHFWREWEDQDRQGDPDEPQVDFDHRAAWRRHFAGFFGVAPENHWLIGGRRFKPWASGKPWHPRMFNPFVAMVMTKGGGLLSLYVLHLLSEQPRYGNDIMRELEERTQGMLGANPGAIYPLLTLLEKRGLVEGSWEEPQKRTRRFYDLTPAGQEELDRLKQVMRPKLDEALSILRSLHDDMKPDQED